MKIWLRVHGYEPCSWTTVWEELRVVFKNQGNKVYDFVEPDDVSDVVEVWWGDPQFWKWGKKAPLARIAIALSEAHSILKHGRENVISNLQQSDLIICPSESATLAFREAPIDVPMKVVYFGVNDTDIYYVDREWDEELRFLHGGVTQFRKGSWLVIEGFLKAFKGKEQVRLTIGSPVVSPMYMKLYQEYKGDSRITFDNARKSTAMEWYRTHHVYVSPHLSEGFGLMIPEAMASGMPCLVSRCSAPRDYFDKSCGWWIEMSENYAPVSDCLVDTDGFWRLPDVDSLAEVMKEAYENREACKDKGVAGSKYVLNNLTWNHTVRGIKKVIEEVLVEKSIGDNVSL